MKVSIIVILSLCMLAVGQVPIGRIAQEEKSSSQVTWTTTGTEIAISEDSELPAGMLPEVVGSNIIIVLEANEPGLYTAKFVVDDFYDPEIENWQGGKIKRRQTAVLLWYVYPREDAPFLSGLGDILIDGTPLLPTS